MLYLLPCPGSTTNGDPLTHTGRGKLQRLCQNMMLCSNSPKPASCVLLCGHSCSPRAISALATWMTRAPPGDPAQEAAPQNRCHPLTCQWAPCDTGSDTGRCMSLYGLHSGGQVNKGRLTNPLLQQTNSSVFLQGLHTARAPYRWTYRYIYS